MPGYQEQIVCALADGAALGTSTTETSIIPATAKQLLRGGLFDRPGKRLHVQASGRVSNIVTTPGTLTFRFKLGPTANIIVAASKAIALNVVAKTNVGWTLDWYLTLRTVGSGTGGTFMHNGVWVSESVVGSAAGQSTAAVLQDAPAVGTGFDTSVVNTLDLTAQWSISNAGNTIQLHEFSVEDVLATP
jgi:hypothetical protein